MLGDLDPFKITSNPTEILLSLSFFQTSRTPVANYSTTHLPISFYHHSSTHRATLPSDIEVPLFEITFFQALKRHRIPSSSGCPCNPSALTHHDYPKMNAPIFRDNEKSSLVCTFEADCTGAEKVYAHPHNAWYYKPSSFNGVRDSQSNDQGSEPEIERQDRETSVESQVDDGEVDINPDSPAELYITLENTPMD